MKRFLTLIVSLLTVLSLGAQDVKEVQFSDKKYEYGIGKDSISLFLKVLDSDGNRSTEVTGGDLEKYLVIYEDGKIISSDRRNIQELSSGQRIPSDFTFSVLVDLNIPEEGKNQIYETVGNLVKSAPDSCVYLSFFGDEVTQSEVITKQNYADYESKFLRNSVNKFFYGAIYSKLAEFSLHSSPQEMRQTG